MEKSISNGLPTGRPLIHLKRITQIRNHIVDGPNHYVSVSLTEPRSENREALIRGIRRILPYIYRSPDEVLAIMRRLGLDFAAGIPLPPSSRFQWAHAGEILICVYFEECEESEVLTYKWRLNTSRNQHQLGMDILAFNLKLTPPHIYAIAVKTTSQGENGKTPSVVYDANNELETYLNSDKLDDDLSIISANFHSDEERWRAFEAWYDPYSQKLPADKPKLIPVPAFVTDAVSWRDEYAHPAIQKDFGIPGAVRVFCVDDLEKMVQQVYARDGI